MSVVQALGDWRRERAIKRLWKKAIAAYRRKDKGSGDLYARMAIKQIKSRSPQQQARLDRKDAEKLRKCRGH